MSHHLTSQLLKGTLFTHTENELPEIVEEAKRHGVEIFESFQALNPKTSYVRTYPRQHLEQLSSLDRVVAAIARDSRRAHAVLQPVESFCLEEGIAPDKNGTPNGIRKNCDEQWIYSLLSGDVTPCCQIKTPMDDKWNLSRHPIDEILRDRHYENVRFNLWNGIFPTYCEGCWKTR